MSLPVSLQPWMEWLQHFDRQLAQLLGKVLLQIEPLFPLPQRQPVVGADEFDGFNGIVTRGQYHRLLASEWVLADDLPDEFMRRAVESEHLFLAPQLKEPLNDGTCLAIFDAGVHQLGSLRVFHVAMWMLLAQRAIQRGSEFRWAIAQQPGKVQTDSSIDALQQLLTARTLAVVSADMQQQWLDYLDDKQNQVAEQWWVGCAEQVTALSAGLCPNRVSLERLLATTQAAAQQVHIQLLTRSVCKELRLAEPQGKPFNKLLQGQFNSRPARHSKARRDGQVQDSLLPGQPSLFVSPCAKYVALLLSDRTAKVWRLPRQRGHRMKLISQNQFASEKNAQFIAAVFNGKQFGGLFLNEFGLHGWVLPDLNYPQSSYQLVRQDGLLRKMPALTRQSWAHHGLYVLDDAGMLVQWKKNRMQSGVTLGQMLIANHVLAIQPAESEQLIYAQQSGQQEIRIVRNHINSNGGNEGRLLHLVALPQPVNRFLLCVNMPWFPANEASWAFYLHRDDVWHMGSNFSQQTTYVQLTKNHQVIALLHDPLTNGPSPQYGRLGLLVLTTGGRSIELLYNSSEGVVLVESATEIMHVTVSGHYMAWVTAEQQLYLMDVQTRDIYCSTDVGAKHAG